MGHIKIRTAVKYTALMVVFALTITQGMLVAGALTATPGHFEFGDLKEGEPAKVTVEIENTSGAPVEITNVRTS